MPLVQVTESFDHDASLYELKLDGFRALAEIRGHVCRLISSRGYDFSKWTLLNEEIAHSVRARSAVLDGEIVCFAPDGRTRFYTLMLRRDWPHYAAFDLVEVDDEDLRSRPLIERKRRLRAIMPRIDSRLFYVDHVERRGIDLFRAACAHDLEGIVGRWRDGLYETDGVSTSWVKIKNPSCSQGIGRREFFQTRQVGRSRAEWRAPTLRLHLAKATLARSRHGSDASG